MKKLLSLGAVLIAFIMVITVSACSSDSSSGYTPEVKSSLKLDYAEKFTADYLADGCTLVTINGEQKILIVPEGTEEPQGIGSDYIVLKQPVDNIYLASTASMDMFAKCGAVGSVRFSPLKADEWTVSEASEAMNNGSLIYAGKYSAPDYEKLTSEGCSLAVENTMILHSPEVREKLESFGIPVMIDYSSYESTPQGRMEWIKLYGLITGHLDEAEKVFKEQIKAFNNLDSKPTGKKVVYFYMTQSGTASVRRSGDYIPQMIELAGGEYVFEEYGLDDDSASPTAVIQLEAFYNAAKDADCIIYSNSINNSVESLEDFTSLNPLFKNLKAVKNGSVYATDSDLFQHPMSLGTFTAELSDALHGTDGSGQSESTFIRKLN